VTIRDARSPRRTNYVRSYLIYVGLRTWDSIAGTRTIYVLKESRFDSGVIKVFSLFENLPHRLWGPPTLIFNVYRCSFRGLKRRQREVGHSPSSSLGVKKWRAADLSPLNVFMQWTGTTLSISVWNVLGAPTILRWFLQFWENLWTSVFNSLLKD